MKAMTACGISGKRAARRTGSPGSGAGAGAARARSGTSKEDGAMIRRTRTFVCLAIMSAAFIAAAPRVSAQTQIEDGWLGTWKENVDKSTYRPGPAPKSPTVAK